MMSIFVALSGDNVGRPDLTISVSMILNQDILN